jgi:ribosomal protein S7
MKSFTIYTEGVFQSKWLSKFINKLTLFGKTGKIERLVYLTFFFIKKELSICPMFFFFEVLEKVRPVIGLKIYKKKGRKVTTKTAMPIKLNTTAQYKKAIFWLRLSISVKEEKQLVSKIFQEFYDTLILDAGNSLKKKKTYYKYAVLFKATRKFKW